ncbi:MAG: error-prone DNA polymerase [Acidimicrobiales bacterium]|nr:error-prone DNA polymerase [Acidimicrobiales bacterium]
MTAPYAELHCHSNFSFLDGASHPEELVSEAARLGLDALALTDHDGLYGVVRFAETARALGLPSIFGAELTLVDGGRQGGRTGAPDPPGSHLVVLARDPEGYARLSRVITEAHLAGGEKGRPTCTLEDLARHHGGNVHGGHWVVLTGCRKGAVPTALTAAGPAVAARELDRLVEAFGPHDVAVELWDHGDPLDTARNDALARLAVTRDLSLVATNNVHYATPARRPLATTLAAVRARRPLAELDGWLPSAATAHLRSGAEQERRFARWPGAVARAAEIGAACAFDLHLVAPGLPDCRVPAGHTEHSWLVELVGRGADHRYGARTTERVPGAWAQIDHELEVIGTLGYAGYFLIVWDIVEFCRRQDIYCQGRGSAANSAVCFALGITRADPVALGLLFERFLSPERDGPPDIDIDIESGRREEVISYVYERYGRHCAAQVANVITYRARSAIRDVGKALGHSPDEVDAWAKAVDRGEPLDRGGPLPPLVGHLARDVLDFPRHLGLHSGGMVLCDRPVIEVCPVEWARHPGRSALQWDKDDCAAAGLVKFDLLGLGMLEAVHRSVDLIRDAHGVEVDLALLDQEDAVYDMLCRADTVGVFQVESRAQMATLPRIRPRCFADLVIEVAIIRPGPIQGGSVHPYIRRRQGLEAPDPPHPLLTRALEKTLGVPLFQEQLMHIAIDAAGFTPAEADELRQAMSAKRSGARMARLSERLFTGMAERGITGAVAQEIVDKLAAFANFGFPESHAVSFAYLVYSSAWLKLHYPAAFCAGLLNAQPMGFWSPQSLVADARRHGVTVRRPHVDVSGVGATLEWGLDDPATVSPGRPVSPGRAGAAGDSDRQPAVRLGLTSVRGIGEAVARYISESGPYSSVEDLVRRTGTGRPQLEALATAGALEGLAPRDGGPEMHGRRSTLWAAGALAHGTVDRLPGLVSGEEAPPLLDLTPLEEVEADMWATGLTVGMTAVELARPRLDAMGVIPAGRLAGAETDGKVFVGGVVTHRQRPESAKGTVFLNLEDETGLVNVICSPGAWERWRPVARGSPALLVRGRIERVDGVVSVVAEKIVPMDLGPAPVQASRDFR